MKLKIFLLATIPILLVLSSCFKNNVAFFGERRLNSSDVSSVFVFIDDRQDNSILKNNVLFNASLREEICKALKAKKNISAIGVSYEDANKDKEFNDIFHIIFLNSGGVQEKQGFRNGRSYTYLEVYATASLCSVKEEKLEILCHVSVAGDGMDVIGDYFNKSSAGQLLGIQPDLKTIYSEVFVSAALSLFSNK